MTDKLGDRNTEMGVDQSLIVLMDPRWRRWYVVRSLQDVVRDERGKRFVPEETYLSPLGERGYHEKEIWTSRDERTKGYRTDQ